MGCSWSNNQPLSDGELENILGKPHEDIKKLYSFGKELGKGNLGTTYMCEEIRSGISYACKSIPKSKLSSEDEKEALKKEIQIMFHLSCQPNIVNIERVYEDKECIHMVMELCGGGELSSRIEASSYYSEKDTAGILKSIVNALQICHAKGVIHCDVKPENFMFSSEDEDTVLKSIGFGSSVYIKQGTELKGKFKVRDYYVAPEVLQGEIYGKEIDIWGAGVILYLLLCGKHPFKTESEIRKGKLDLESQPWPCVSESAKDLVNKMLTKDPKTRISASNVLEHPWIQREAPYKLLDNVLVLRIKRFGALNQLKKLALYVIAEGLAEELIKDDKYMFEAMDTDGSGSITYGELRKELRRPGSNSNLSLTEARKLMEAADVDGNGKMDLYEYISVMTKRHVLVTDENLHKAFQYFNKDGSGYITKYNLMKGVVGDEAIAIDIISEVDKNNEGRIDFDEFCAMMRDEKLQPQGKLVRIH